MAELNFGGSPGDAAHDEPYLRWVSIVGSAVLGRLGPAGPFPEQATPDREPPAEIVAAVLADAEVSAERVDAVGGQFTVHQAVHFGPESPVGQD